MNKKIYLSIAVGIVFCALIGWSVSVMSANNAKEAMAKNFLTTIYQVQSHDKYKNLTINLSDLDRIAENVPTREEAFAEYTKLYDPLTTENGYEQVAANVDYLRADTFASENKYLLTVKSITLKSSYSDKEKVQYEYTVVTTASPENGASPTDITAEGNMVLKKDIDNVFRINTFKPFSWSIYDNLK